MRRDAYVNNPKNFTRVYVYEVWYGTVQVLPVVSLAWMYWRE